MTIRFAGLHREAVIPGVLRTDGQSIPDPFILGFH